MQNKLKDNNTFKFNLNQCDETTYLFKKTIMHDISIKLIYRSLFIYFFIHVKDAIKLIKHYDLLVYSYPNLDNYTPISHNV